MSSQALWWRSFSVLQSRLLQLPLLTGRLQLHGQVGGWSSPADNAAIVGEVQAGAGCLAGAQPLPAAPRALPCCSPPRARGCPRRAPALPTQGPARCSASPLGASSSFSSSRPGEKERHALGIGTACPLLGVTLRRGQKERRCEAVPTGLSKPVPVRLNQHPSCQTGLSLHPHRPHRMAQR